MMNKREKKRRGWIPRRRATARASTRAACVCGTPPPGSRARRPDTPTASRCGTTAPDSKGGGGAGLTRSTSPLKKIETTTTPHADGRGRARVSRRVQRLRGDAEGARASVRERHDKNPRSVVRWADGQGRARLGADGFVRRGERFKHDARRAVSRNRQATRRGVSGGSSRAPARRGDARASRDAQELPRDVLRHLASVRVRVSHEAEHARRADPRARDKRRAAERNAGKARRALANVGGRLRLRLRLERRRLLRVRARHGSRERFARRVSRGEGVFRTRSDAF